MVRIHGEITDRDVELLSWVGRFRGVTSSQVAAWFMPGAADGVRVVNRRMKVFRDHGLVRSERVLAEYPSVHTLTRAGMVRVNVFGAVKRPHVGQFVHDLAVTDLLLWLRAAEPGLRCLTEREIRAIDHPDTQTPKYAVRRLVGSESRLLYPDLITVSGDGSARAHEVENSPKDKNRMWRLMMSYATNPRRVLPVTYYAKPGLRRRLETALSAAQDQAPHWGVSSIPVSITGWDWVGEAA